MWKLLVFNKEQDILRFKISTSYPLRKLLFCVDLRTNKDISLHTTDWLLARSTNSGEVNLLSGTLSLKVVSRLWRLATGLSTQRLLLSPESLPVSFVVDKVALLQDLFRGFQVSPVIIISPTLHTHHHLHTDLVRKTNWRNLETFTHQFSLGQEEVTVREVKVKAVPLQAWSGPECSRNLRFPGLE